MQDRHESAHVEIFADEFVPRWTIYSPVRASERDLREGGKIPSSRGIQGNEKDELVYDCFVSIIILSIMYFAVHIVDTRGECWEDNVSSRRKVENEKETGRRKRR